MDSISKVIDSAIEASLAITTAHYYGCVATTWSKKLSSDDHLSVVSISLMTEVL